MLENGLSKKPAKYFVTELIKAQHQEFGSIGKASDSCLGISSSKLGNDSD
jgi:hypothetical protein